MNLDDIKRLDAEDPLASCYNAFLLPENLIYLDGNSLGPLPKAVRARVDDVVNREWSQDLIHSWNKNAWIDLPVTVGEKIAPLIGAASGQVVCCDSISINVFKLLAFGLACRPNRKIVLSQTDNFPTDLYVAEGLVKLLGEQRCVLKTVDSDALFDALDESVAVLLLTHVNFRTGEMHDMARLTQAAHDKGVMVIWDLAHSAGAVPLVLDACGVDFAVGCGYKYLNGGPGAPAFIYVARRHQQSATQPLCGWMGHQSPFAFDTRYVPANTVQQFLSGTPNILSMAALDAALSAFADVPLTHIRQKSLNLSDLFLQLVAGEPSLSQLDLLTPRVSEKRGSQLAFSHPEAYAICQALAAMGVVADYRAPNILRFGLTPLYLRYEDIWHAVYALTQVFKQKLYDDEKFRVRQKVT